MTIHILLRQQKKIWNMESRTSKYGENNTEASCSSRAITKAKLCSIKRAFTWLSEGFIVVFCMFNPSRMRTNRMFAGKSSTSSFTRTRHSGHLNSFLLSTISSKHLLQNVCWHGNTLELWSSCSRHTEHSKSSFKRTGMSMSAHTRCCDKWPWIPQWQSISYLPDNRFAARLLQDKKHLFWSLALERSDQNICSTSNVFFPIEDLTATICCHAKSACATHKSISLN